MSEANIAAAWALSVQWRRARSVLVVLLLVFLPTVAFAHGRLKSSSPSAGAHLGTVPRVLRFEFSEVPDLTFSSVKLFGPDGREVTLEPLAYSADSRRAVTAGIRAMLHAGAYQVQWQLAGDDGHPVRGSFTFVVAPGAMGADDGHDASGANGVMMPMPDSGADSMAMHHDPASMPQGNAFGAESPAYIVVRWIQFTASLLAIGAVAFRQFVLARLRRSGAHESPTLAIMEAGAARVGLVATSALVVTLVLRLVAQSYAMHGAADAWNITLSAQMIRNTTWGRGWIAQLAGVLVAGAGFLIAHRARTSQIASPAQRTIGWPLASLGVALVAVSLALSGHASASPRLRVLAVIADTVHALSASSWLGALALVLIVGLPATLTLAEADRGPTVAALIAAFSPVALVSAGLAAVTGLFAAWIHVGRIPNLWGTRYGITLLVKLAVLGVVALTGFYNWRVVKPRLGTGDATVHLRRSARVEVAVAVLVLLVTAVLVATPTSMDMEM